MSAVAASAHQVIEVREEGRAGVVVLVCSPEGRVGSKAALQRTEQVACGHAAHSACQVGGVTLH